MERGSRIDLLLRDENGRFYPAWITCHPPFTYTLSTSITINGEPVQWRDPEQDYNEYHFSEEQSNVIGLLMVSSGIRAKDLKQAIEIKLRPKSFITWASSSSTSLQVESLDGILQAATYDPTHLRIR